MNLQWFGEDCVCTGQQELGQVVLQHTASDPYDQVRVAFPPQQASGFHAALKNEYSLNLNGRLQAV